MNNIMNTETGEFGLHAGDVRSWFAQQKIAAAIADEFVGELGPFASYAATEQPSFDSETDKAEQIEPVEIDGVLTQQWQIVPLSTQELAQAEAERLAAEQAAKDAVRITVTKRQACLALLDLKAILRTDIAAALSTIADPVVRERTQIDWDEAKDIESDSPTALTIATALHLSEADMQVLFDYASAL